MRLLERKFESSVPLGVVLTLTSLSRARAGDRVPCEDLLRPRISCAWALLGALLVKPALLLARSADVGLSALFWT